MESSTRTNIQNLPRGYGALPHVGELPSNAVDMVQPLLDHQQAESAEQHHRHSSHSTLKDPSSPFDDTVDFGCTIPETSSFYSRQSSWSTPPPVELIDNTSLVYIPIRLACGNQVYCAPGVLSNCPMILRSLQADLEHILQLLPWSVHALVKRTNIWVNASYSYGSRDDPRVLRHSTAHHEQGWLIECARDRPAKARGIEIYSCFDFERMRLHWNGSGLLLHEFCHLLHQFCLGLDCSVVDQLYKEACNSGRYQDVLRRDWAGKEEDFDMAYATVDVKEFFAEMSVTYLSDGYHELDKASCSIMEDCSPPLLEPTVTRRLLKEQGIEGNPYQEKTDDKCSFWSSLLGKHRNLLRGPKPKLRTVHPLWQEAAIARGCRDVTHCNKFYPFTRGQLKHYDPDVFVTMHHLWNEIAMYDDPQEERSCCASLRHHLLSMRAL